MTFSYEEIRRAAIDILAGRAEERYSNTQYVHFRENIATVLKKRAEEGAGGPVQKFEFTKQDDRFVQEVFWDLFRQGIITQGSENNPSEGYPWFCLSSYGGKLINDEGM